MKKKQICFVTTWAGTLDLFNRGIFEHLRDKEWEVTGICGSKPQQNIDNVRGRGFKVIVMPLVRPPSPLIDTWCLFRLWWFFLWNRFDVINTSTPKAVLLGSIAAIFAFQPCRITTFRGRAYENDTGLKRHFYVLIDRFVTKMSRYTICVSPSMKKAMLEDQIGTDKKLILFRNGGSKGVDVNEFDRRNVPQHQVEKFRSSSGIPPSDKIALFVGRIREDKGMNELIPAFVSISEELNDWHLVLVGPVEAPERIDASVHREIEEHPKIHTTGQMDDPRVAYAASDLFVFPTWREGMPNVVLEASAMELAVVTTDATGAIDSVVDNQTGIIVKMQNAEALRAGMETLMKDADLRQKMGIAGRDRVAEDFCPIKIKDFLLDLFESAATR